MIQEPLISILMPAYNAAKYIKEAIESILNQTYNNFELIIINDGSCDNTKEIIQSYTDKRILYLENSENLKIIRTLNKGIDYVNGKYIARMDADDIALPQWLEIQYHFLTNHDADVVSGHLLYLSADGKEVYYNERGNLFLTPSDIYNIIPFDTCIAHPGIIFKSEILRKYRYNENNQVLHFEDYDLWNRMCKDNIKIWKHTTPIMLWRLNPMSITHSYTLETIERISQYKKINICNTFKIKPQEAEIFISNYIQNFRSYRQIISFWIQIYSKKQVSKAFKSWLILHSLHFIKNAKVNEKSTKILCYLYMIVRFPSLIFLLPKIYKHRKLFGGTQLVLEQCRHS